MTPESWFWNKKKSTKQSTWPISIRGETKSGNRKSIFGPWRPPKNVVSLNHRSFDPTERDSDISKQGTKPIAGQQCSRYGAL